MSRVCQHSFSALDAQECKKAYLAMLRYLSSCQGYLVLEVGASLV
jgi:hypothetical protein